jgi:hypothetical protein
LRQTALALARSARLGDTHRLVELCDRAKDLTHHNGCRTSPHAIASDVVERRPEALAALN